MLESIQNSQRNGFWKMVFIYIKIIPFHDNNMRSVFNWPRLRLTSIPGTPYRPLASPTLSGGPMSCQRPVPVSWGIVQCCSIARESPGDTRRDPECSEPFYIILYKIISPQKKKYHNSRFNNNCIDITFQKFTI